ncbi:hypothetical protein ACINB_24510 [Acidovorax sp. NB1]|nr:hypothetical protein ACINB_24510 [Acidovorax sp. NB1]
MQQETGQPKPPRAMCGTGDASPYPDRLRTRRGWDKEAPAAPVRQLLRGQRRVAHTIARRAHLQQVDHAHHVIHQQHRFL